MKKNKLLVFYFLLTIPILANDFYPLNITPANGEMLDYGPSIPITFDVCLGFDYPASASEWHIEIKIIDSFDQLVYSESIDGFDVNGPACFPINNAPDFIPPAEGIYSIGIQTFYDQEINLENDLLISDFGVFSTRDLAVIDILSPSQIGGVTLFAGLDIEFVVLVRNEGNVAISKNDYQVGINTIIQGASFPTTYSSYCIEDFDIAPGAEIELKVRHSEYVLEEIPKNLNKQMQTQAFVSYSADENISNNIFEGSTMTFVPNPIWPNEFRFGDGLSKTTNNLADNDFVEFIVTDKFSDPELYTLLVYDSNGVQVDSTSLDLFTVGETVDSFTVYSYEFNGDVLSNHGAIALTYDSLRFSDYFISWGGPITAVEGPWKDSTSTDIGITVTPGNSISLSGHGTDFSSFTWESSIPTPGLFNDSQLVPVEEQLTVPNQYKLEQNYPNPFNPTTTINYTIPVVEAKFASTTNVLIKLFDVLGREVRTLVNEVQSAGNYEVSLDATELTSGVYYYQLTAGDYMETRKMSLLK